MTQPDAVDAANPPDPAKAAALGIKVIAAYIGRQDWKSQGPDYVKACHAHNIGFSPLYEDQATNAKGGAAQGSIDGARAKQRMDALVAGVGYAPRNVVRIGAAVDFDTTPSEYPAIDAYLKAFDQANGAWGELDYGEADLIDHEHATGIDPVGFGTYAWSGGRVSRYSVLQQYLNGQHFAGTTVDYDHLVNAAALGVWWPPNHPLNTGDDPLADLTPAQLSQIAAAVWAFEIPNKTDATGKPVSTAHASQFFTWLVKTEQAQSQMAAAVKAAVAQLGVTGVDPDALAQAVVAHLGIDVVAK